MITIERIENGWLIKRDHHEPKAVLTEQDLLEEVLLMACGRCDSFGGTSYGKVSLSLKEPKS